MTATGQRLRQFFMVILVAQVTLGLANSLFVLTDQNVALSLFGFYGVVANNVSALILYILFNSLLSVIIDVVRVILWQFSILGHTLGYLNTLQTYYVALIAFGAALKVIGGIFSFFLIRKYREQPSSEEQDALMSD